MGSSPSAILGKPREKGLAKGCSTPVFCNPTLCGRGTCVDLWGGFMCHCAHGERFTIGDFTFNVAGLERERHRISHPVIFLGSDGGCIYFHSLTINSLIFY